MLIPSLISKSFQIQRFYNKYSSRIPIITLSINVTASYRNYIHISRTLTLKNIIKRKYTILLLREGARRFKADGLPDRNTAQRFEGDARATSKALATKVICSNRDVSHQSKRPVPRVTNGFNDRLETLSFPGISDSACPANLFASPPRLLLLRREPLWGNSLIHLSKLRGCSNFSSRKWSTGTAFGFPGTSLKGAYNCTREKDRNSGFLSV